MENTRLFFCILPQNISEREIVALTDALPDRRKEKAAAFKGQSGRLLCAASWHLLRYCAKQVFDIDVFGLNITENEKNKPHFTDKQNYHFNISHCPTAITCALDLFTCGVDVEPLRKANFSVAKRFMNAVDYTKFISLENSLEQDGFFTMKWTEFESIYKAGTGGLRDDYLLRRYKIGNYFLSLYAKSRLAPCETEMVDFSQLKYLI